MQSRLAFAGNYRLRSTPDVDFRHFRVSCRIAFLNASQFDGERLKTLRAGNDGRLRDRLSEARDNPFMDYTMCCFSSILAV
jgi:hypothetical protein